MDSIKLFLITEVLSLILVFLTFKILRVADEKGEMGVLAIIFVPLITICAFSYAIAP